MPKKDMIETLTSLNGIGKAKAEALVDAGFDTVNKIQKASIEDLTKVNGISDSVAKSIKDQLGSEKSDSKEEKPVKKVEKEVTKEKPAEKPVKSDKPKKKEKTGEGKQDYQVKKKPELSDDLKKNLYKRKKIKKRTPEFRREEWFRYKRLGKSWRRPDGISSKMRRNFKYRPNKVRVGFGGPSKTRGLHPSGFEEIMIYNCKELELIDPKTQAARIGSSVGTRKRLDIEKKAKELDIRLLNK